MCTPQRLDSLGILKISLHMINKCKISPRHPIKNFLANLSECDIHVTRASIDLIMQNSDQKKSPRYAEAFTSSVENWF